MNWSQRIVEKYPLCFTDGFPACGISCPVGWRPLVENLIVVISDYMHYPKYVLRFPRASRLFTKIHNRLFDWIFPFPPNKILTVKEFDSLKSKFPVRYFLLKVEKKIYQKLEFVHQTVAQKIEPISVIQIKEKFGTLRFYYSGGDQQVAGMVRVAEHLSATICQNSGEHGDLCVRDHFPV